MSTRRIVCIESELRQCERELRGLLGDARGVLQSGEVDALPGGDAPSDEVDAGAPSLDWSTVVSFFRQLPSFVEMDTKLLDDSQKSGFAKSNYEVRVDTNILWKRRASLKLRYGYWHDAYCLRLRQGCILCMPYSIDMYGSYTPREDKKYTWRKLTSLVDYCKQDSGPISLARIVEDVLKGCNIIRTDWHISVYATHLVSTYFPRC
jgi:hypothetical protein